MGATDAGYLGADLSTPNLDMLATEGLKLENYYVQQLCTPTRTQLLTGTKIKLQNSKIRECRKFEKFSKILLALICPCREIKIGKFGGLIQAKVAI